MDLSGNEWHIGGARLYIGWPQYIYCQGHIKTAPPYHIGYRVTATGGRVFILVGPFIILYEKTKTKKYFGKSKKDIFKNVQNGFWKKSF